MSRDEIRYIKETEQSRMNAAGGGGGFTYKIRNL
jgi:hypothetical protein